MYSSIKTIELKLFRPSKRKKQIIDEAMLNYTLAFQYLLDNAKEQIENIKENYMDATGRYKAKNICKWFDSNISCALNNFKIEPLKDSLKMDFAASMAGYLNLAEKGCIVEYPRVHINNKVLNKELNEAMNSNISCNEDLDKVIYRIEKIMKKNESRRPIFFCRYATNRNYCLLHDPLENKYLVKLYLMNANNKKRKSFDTNSNKVLRYVNKDKELFKVHGKREGFIIVPLSFGVWQEKYLKQALENPEILKTARLIKRKKDYYISINLEISNLKEIEIKSYMGISRGIENTINYAIVDKAGVLKQYGFEKLDNYPIQLNSLHKLANNIVEIASRNNSKVVMERLINMGDKINWIGKDGSEYKAQLGCYEYNHLYKILKYKLPEKGLSPPIRVSSTGIFYTCPRCGCNSKYNRFSEKIFICTSCGMSLHIEEAASINLAKIINKYNKDFIKIKLENTSSGIILTNEELGLNILVKDEIDYYSILENEIKKIVTYFKENLDTERKNVGFKKKYSIIKKLEDQEDISKYIKII